MERYLDNAATTAPCEACVAAELEALRKTYGNPSSLHSMGVRAERLLTQARARVAAALKVSPEEILFTSGATESNHLALRGAATEYGRRRRRVVITAVEHSSVRGAAQMLEEQGYEVCRTAPDKNAFLAAVNDSTCVASMMLVNNETGALLPVAETFREIKKNFPRVITHCDAVQGFLKIPFTPRELSADLVTVSGHKVHAAKGVGALYHARGVRLFPLWRGGEQENGLRPGTEAVSLIAGFGAAVESLSGNLNERYEHARALRQRALERLCPPMVPQSPDESSPYILSLSLEGVRSETLLHFLAERGIYVSSGSACAKGRPTGVLEAFGIAREKADSTIRVSFSEENTFDDIEALRGALEEAQARLIRKF